MSDRGEHAFDRVRRAQMIPMFGREVIEREQHLAVEWFLQEVEGFLPNGAYQLRVDFVDAAGHENDFELRIDGLEFFHQFETVHVRHLNIEDRKIRTERFRQLQCFAGESCSSHLVVMP